MNTKKIYIGVSYLVSLVYVFLGVVIQDWTVHMAPSMPGEKNARGVFIEIFLISYGIIFFITTFLRVRNKVSKLSPAILFYAGLTIIFVIGAVASAADYSPENSFLYNLGQFLIVALVLYVPALALYLFRPKIQEMP